MITSCCIVRVPALLGPVGLLAVADRPHVPHAGHDVLVPVVVDEAGHVVGVVEGGLLDVAEAVAGRRVVLRHRTGDV